MNNEFIGSSSTSFVSMSVALFITGLLRNATVDKLVFVVENNVLISASLSYNLSVYDSI